MCRKIVFLNLFLMGVATWVVAQNCWTNTAGHAFSAELISLTDTHATFVMYTGETNTLAVGALCPVSQAIARDVSQLPEIPDRLKPTFNICRQDLKRLANLNADGRLNIRQYSEAQEKILLAFHTMCKKHDLSEEQYPALKARLLSSVN
jgi:hypothetical protein